MPDAILDMVFNNGYVVLTGDAFKEATEFFFRLARREDLQHVFFYNVCQNIYILPCVFDVPKYFLFRCNTVTYTFDQSY